MQERKKNPMKELAIHLAHAMDDQQRIYNEDLREHEIKEIRQYLSEINNKIIRNGYDVETMLHLADQYKTLKWAEYREWVYN